MSSISYNLFSITFRVCFAEGHLVTYSYSFDCICDIIYAADIFLRCFVFGFIRNERLVTSSAEIFKNYYFKNRFSFLFHSSASIPIELFALFGKIGTLSTGQTVYLLRLNRIFRFIDYRLHFQYLEKCISTPFIMSAIRKNLIHPFENFCIKRNYFQMSEILSNFTSYRSSFFSGRDSFYDSEFFDASVRSNSNLFSSQSNRNLRTKKMSKFTIDPLQISFRLASFISLMYAVGHVAGCIFFMIANQTHLYGNIDNWADEHHLLRNCTFGYFSSNEFKSNQTYCFDQTPSYELMSRQYVASVYWALQTLSTIGYGDVRPRSVYEIAFALFAIFCGIVMYCILLNRILIVYAKIHVSTSMWDEKILKLSNLLHRENSSADFAERCRR